MARITTAQQPHLFAPSSDTVFWIPFVPPSRARTSSFFALPEGRWREKKSSGWRRGGGGRMALWYMVPVVLRARELARELAGGGVSALMPAPLIKLGCVLDASTCQLHKRRRAEVERSNTARDQRSAGSSVPRTLESVQQVGEERAEIAGAGEYHKTNHAQAALFS